MMDVDEVGTCLTRRVAALEAKLDNANYILQLLVEAINNPANNELVTRLTRSIVRERLGFLF